MVGIPMLKTCTGYFLAERRYFQVNKIKTEFVALNDDVLGFNMTILLF